MANRITKGKLLAGAIVAELQATPASIGTTELANDAVTNDKLANITRGSVKVGGASNAPTDLDAKTSGQILVGDGTDVVSVAVSGDATLAANGALTIANDAVTLAKMADIARGSIIVGGAANAPTALDANNSGQILVGDGTDLASVAVSGDVTLAANGAVTIANDAVTTVKINNDAVTAAKALTFVSTEQTGSGSEQSIAHGLGATPSIVIIAVTEHPGTPDTGAFDVAEGVHDGTNVLATVTLNVKYKVFAWA